MKPKTYWQCSTCDHIEPRALDFTPALYVSCSRWECNGQFIPTSNTPDRRWVRIAGKESTIHSLELDIPNAMTEEEVLAYIWENHWLDLSSEIINFVELP